MRKYVYILCVILFASLVFIKSRTIKGKWEKEIITIEKLWQTHGKPVEVIKAQKKEISFYKTISGTLKDSFSIRAMVPLNIMDKIKVGQKFYISQNNTKNISGTVTHVSPTPDVFTGLFNVDLKLASIAESLKTNDIVMASINIETSINKIILPIGAIVKEGDKSFCWVIEDRRATKRQLVLGRPNQYFIEIDFGLLSGDLVVILGKENLIEDDLVNMNNTIGDLQ